MILGHTYSVSFKTSLAGGGPHYDLASNHIGVRFSTVAFDSLNNPAPIDNLSHVYVDTVITDTTNWTLISREFIADSAYQYIMVGNFFDDIHTDTLHLSQTSNSGYYFVDEVSVMDGIGNGMATLNSQSKFAISPNPVQNLLTINFLSPSPASGVTIAVYDVAGRKIVLPTTYFAESAAGGPNNKAELTTTTLPNGIYLVQIINNKTGMCEVGKFVKE